MNILIFNEAAWDDKNSLGNTISNFFCGEAWKDDCFYNFYVRNQAPENHVNAVYYNLSAVDILKGVGKLRVNGRRFSTDDIPAQKNALDKTHEKEQRKIDKLHKYKNEYVYYAHELIWRSRIWLNRYFKSFVQEASPDILFAFTTSPFILWPLIQYLKKNTGCKVVLLAADDVYGSIENCAFYRRGYLKRALVKSLMSADKIYAISVEMAAVYSTLLGKECTPLYKGCDLSETPKGTLNQPLRFVYAGNLLYGRDDTLAEIASAIERINGSGEKAMLEIYTGTTITQELREKLERGNSSRIRGARPYEEIKHIMHDADVVLHVESFEAKAIETVRYSFSTKIIDCLQSGVQVLGIGPGEVASIRYLKKVDGAIVADDIKQIESVVSELIRRKEMLLINAQKTRQFAVKKHELSAVQKKLRIDFEKVIKE